MPNDEGRRPPLLYHDLHLPDEVRVFTVPHANIRRWTDDLLVYDGLIGDLVLRHYAFADRWFVINCTLDRRGGFVAEPGPIAWSFNCDLCTPPRWDGDACFLVDLVLDVLVAPDGRQYFVKDEPEFAAAVAHGWLTAAEIAGARHGLADLLAIITTTGLVPFLDAICPFQPLPEAVAPPPMQRRPVSEVPALQWR